MECIQWTGVILDTKSQSGMIFTLQSRGDNPVPLSYAPIGIIHSTFTDIAGMLIQPSGAGSGSARNSPQVLWTWMDFSRISFMYAFHQYHGYSLEVKP